MRKILKMSLVLVIFVFGLTACSNTSNNTKLNNTHNDTIVRLPRIPSEIIYNKSTYFVVNTIKEVDVDKEIGQTDDNVYKVFSLKDISTDDAAAILVNENPVIYYQVNKK